MLARCNQKRMNTDPFEEMLRSMGYRANDFDNDDDDGEGSEGGESFIRGGGGGGEEDDDSQQMQCRTS